MLTLIKFELQKIFSRRLTQIALVILLLYSALLTFSTYQNMYAYDGASREGTGKTAVEIDQTIAQKYAGPLTDDKVQAILREFAPKSDLHGLNAKYLYHNAIQSAAFARFADIDGSWNGQSVAETFGSETIQIGYINGWLNTSQNLVKIFLLQGVIIIIMLAPVFAGEYSGPDNLILTSKFGRTKCPSAKVWASLCAALLLTAVTALFNLGLALALYGGNGLNCSILFAPLEFTEFYIPFNITCGVLLAYQVLLGFTCALSLTGLTLILSALCKNQTAALIASAALYLGPIMLPIAQSSPLFRLVSLLPLFQAQFISLMSLAQISGGLLYAIWAVPAAGLLAGAGSVLSSRIFARHQVTSG